MQNWRLEASIDFLSLKQRRLLALTKSSLVTAQGFDTRHRNRQSLIRQSGRLVGPFRRAWNPIGLVYRFGLSLDGYRIGILLDSARVKVGLPEVPADSYSLDRDTGVGYDLDQGRYR